MSEDTVRLIGDVRKKPVEEPRDAELTRLRADNERLQKELSEKEAALCRAREAIRGLNALVEETQETMTSYLIPDGIGSDEAINYVLGLLDGPRQRDIQNAAYAVLFREAGEHVPCQCELCAALTALRQKESSL